jgi:two-component system phosphate regulon sensor histidine kinase PhoR
MSFFIRLFLSYAAVVLVAGAFMGTSAIFLLHRQAEQRLQEQSDSLAGFLAALTGANPSLLWSPHLKPQLQRVARQSNLALLVVLPDGEVIAASDAQQVSGETNLLRLPEFEEAKQTGRGSIRRKLDGRELLFSVRTVVYDGEPVAYLRLGLPAKSVTQDAETILIHMLLAFAASVLLCLLCGWFFTRYLTQPLAEIKKGCRRILHGEVDSKIALEQRDEFGLVAKTVNQMTGQLTGKIRESSLQRNRMELILQSLHDAVLVVEQGGTITFFNSAAGPLLETVDREWPLNIHRHVRYPSLVSCIAEALAGKQPGQAEISWQSEAETKRFAEVFFERFYADQHDANGLLCVIRDQTKAKGFEELRRAFSSNVSHELKTPISAISAILETIQYHPEMEPERRQRFLQKIQYQNERMLRLVNELLALSKLESGTNVLDLSWCDLRQVIRSVEATFVPIAENRKIDFHVEIDPDLELRATADSRAVEVILNSLIDNALRHGPREGWVSLEAVRSETFIEFRVRDNGPGIPAEAQPRIFERFFRVDASRSRVRGGSGLGLAIVKHLVQAHGGSIELAGSNASGTCFAIRLPIQRPDDVTADAEAFVMES